jgi:Xaa-Pro aminopeptidase
LTDTIARLCKAVDAEDVDGWLFYGFQHRDPLAEDLLGLSNAAVNTRRWFYILFSDPARCIKITHAVEKNYLSVLPGKEYVYSSLSELRELFKNYDGLYLAAQFSPELPIFSFLDYGTALLLKEAGISISSSGTLIQKVKGILNADGIASHERSAGHLYEIVNICRERLSSALANGIACREGDVQEWILDEFDKRGLIFNHPPIVAAGPNSRDPHYTPENGGALIGKDTPVQLDLWAKEKAPGAVYADISWVLYTGKNVPEELSSVFSTIIKARDGVVDFLQKELPRRRVSGTEADTIARKVLVESGYQRGIRHRTGHGIDTEAHGYGVNLDSVEFPDTRPFLDGSCFSVEPGLYLEKFGMRTEINVYIMDAIPVISGGPVQQKVTALF